MLQHLHTLTLTFILLLSQIISIEILDSKNYYHLISQFSNVHIVTKPNYSSLKNDNFIAISDSNSHINFLSLDGASIKLMPPIKTSLVLSSSDEYTIGYTYGNGNYKYISYLNTIEQSMYYKIYTSSNDILYTAKYSNSFNSNTLFPIPPLYMEDSLYIMAWLERNPAESNYVFKIAFQTYLSKKQTTQIHIIKESEITNYTCFINEKRIIGLYYSNSSREIIINVFTYDEQDKTNIFSISELDFPEISNEHKYFSLVEGYPYQYYLGCLLVENKGIYCVVFEFADIVTIKEKIEFVTTAKYENIVIKATEETKGDVSKSLYNNIYISWFEGGSISFIQVNVIYPHMLQTDRKDLYYKYENIKSLNILVYDSDNALLLIEDDDKNIGFYSMTSYLFRNNTRYIDVEPTGTIDFSSSLIMKYNDNDDMIQLYEFKKDTLNLFLLKDEKKEEINFQNLYDNKILLRYETIDQVDMEITFNVRNQKTFNKLLFNSDCRNAFPFDCDKCEMHKSLTCTSCKNNFLYEGICYNEDEFDINKLVKKRKICSGIKDNGHCEECAANGFYNELTDDYDKEDCILDCAVYNGHLKDQRCVKSCHKYEIINEDNVCYNCASGYLFNYRGKCIVKDHIPLNTYIKDINYNYVEDCHPICRGCTSRSTNVDEHNCLECTSNYTLKDSLCQCGGNYGEIIEEEENTLTYKCDNCQEYSFYNVDNHCVKEKPPRMYIKDYTYNILGHCYENCEDCNEGGTDENNNCIKCIVELFLNQKNCVKDCPGNMVNNNESGICDDCVSDEKYFDPGIRQCVVEYPNGYYIKGLNVITKCPINCDDPKDIPPHLEYEICQNSLNKCSVPIVGDDTDIKIVINPLPDISSKLEQYTQGPVQDKVETLKDGNNVLVNTSYNVQNIENILYNIVELARTTKLSHEEKQGHDLNRQSINHSVNSLSKIINLDNFRDEYLREEPAIKVQTIALTTYYITYNIDYIEIRNGLELSKTEDVLIQLISKLDPQPNDIKDSAIINKQDFITIISETTNTMISILNKTHLIDTSFNETRYNTDEKYKYQTALISQDVTKTGLTVLENNAKMIVDLSSTTQYLVKPFSNIKYVTISLKDYVQELGPVDNQILVSNGECDYSYTEGDNGKTNEYLVQVCVDFKSILKQFDTAKYLGLVQYSHYPLLNPNITKGISKAFTAINIFDDNNQIVPCHYGNSNVSLVGRRDKGFENCLFKNDSLLLSNSNCTSSIINDHYLKCTCNHGTDFTLSSLNGALIFNDIKIIFTQIRFIQSFDAFRLLSLSNAEALYIILGIVLIYVIVLIFSIKSDRRNNHHILYKVISDSSDYKKLIENMSITEDLDSIVNTIDDKIMKRSKEKKGETNDNNDNNNNDDDDDDNDNAPASNVEPFQTMNQEIVQNREGTALFGDIDDPQFITLTNEIQNKTINQDPKISNSLGNYSPIKYTTRQWLRILGIIIIEFFKSQFWFSYLFLPYHNKNPKTIYVTLFFLKIFLKFAVAALLSTCNYKDELSDSFFNNRRFAVSLLTILIVKIPVLFIGWLLSSKSVEKNKSIFPLYWLLVKYFGLFSGLIIGVIYGSVNTIWITGDAFSKGGGCQYKQDFLMALLGNLSLVKISVVLLSAFVYFIIGRNYIKKQRINWGCIKMIACFPVLFALKYQS